MQVFLGTNLFFSTDLDFSQKFNFLGLKITTNFVDSNLITFLHEPIFYLSQFSDLRFFSKKCFFSLKYSGTCISVTKNIIF